MEVTRPSSVHLSPVTWDCDCYIEVVVVCFQVLARSARDQAQGLETATYYPHPLLLLPPSSENALKPQRGGRSYMEQPIGSWTSQTLVKEESRVKDCARDGPTSGPPDVVIDGGRTSAHAQARARQMQAGLLTSYPATNNNSSLLPKEDVDSFFRSLDKPGERFYPAASSDTGAIWSSSATRAPSAESLSNSLSRDAAMFQQSVPGMHGTGSPYHHDPTSNVNTFLHTGTSPVYVPTTRGMLPGVQYVSNGGSQGGATQSTGPVWGMHAQTEATGYTTASTVPSRFTFPPTPSPSVNSPTGRTVGDNSFGTPLARPGGLSPYSPYVGSDLTSPWNSLNQSMALGSQQPSWMHRGPPLGK